GGIPTACAVPPVPQKKVPDSRSSQKDTPPWEEERPPLPEEPGERIAYQAESEPAPAPVSRVEKKPADTPVMAALSGDLWPGLVAGLRGKFPAVYPFLSYPSAVQGLLEDSVLTLWVDTDFTKNMVGTSAVLEALEKL